MRDKMGKLPKPKNAKDALVEIRKISLDKRSHILKDDHIEWLELKLKAIGILAKRGLTVKKPGVGKVLL
jgi:hypothetical protein